MNKYPAEVLIITRSIALQQGLGALLESLPGIGVVKASPALSKAYHWIELHQPRIVLLDIALTGSDPRLALQQVKQCSPSTRRVLLVDDVQAVKWLSHLAEAVLIKGGSAANVASLVDDLLSSEAETDDLDHLNV